MLSIDMFSVALYLGARVYLLIKMYKIKLNFYRIYAYRYYYYYYLTWRSSRYSMYLCYIMFFFKFFECCIYKIELLKTPSNNYFITVNKK